MKFTRSSGVLIHPSAFQSPYGIGDFGPASYAFIDLLAKAKQKYWQVLPLTQANKEGCPYSSYGAFGGYELLVSPEKMLELGLLKKEDLESFSEIDSDVDFPAVANKKDLIFKKAFKKFQGHETFDEFLTTNEQWLHSYCEFMALTDQFGIPWTQWPKEFRNREFSSIPADIEYQKSFHMFKQWLFHKQWGELKNYANDKGIQIIGDLPIFVGHHSVDAWLNPQQFKLNEDQEMEIEVGAPPDIFNDLGQKWNNPNYDWEYMNNDGFSWWKKRIHYLLNLVDIIRVDHFIGFYNVWEIPHQDHDARNGSWVVSKGSEFLTAIQEEFPHMPFVAEDLGEICDEAIELRDRFNLPGMRIIQFGFDGNADNEHHPNNIPEHCLYYTGTHDNNTLKGHLNEVIERDEKKEVSAFENAFGLSLNSEKFSWKMVEETLKSKAHTAILPLQDILELGEEARFNLPGTCKGNWLWRIPKGCDLNVAFKKFGDLTTEYNRG